MWQRKVHHGPGEAPCAPGTDTERRVRERDGMKMNRKERNKPGEGESALQYLFFLTLFYQKPGKENVKYACRWRCMRPEKTIVGREESD